ncbi:MAG: sensor histidine kinase [Clostridium sp.]
MRVGDFFKDKILFLLVNLIGFMIISIFVYFSTYNFMVIVFTFLIWFGPLLTYMGIQCYRFKRYFDSINSVLECLDKKYLLPEVIETQGFIEGEKVGEFLSIVSRDMHENIKYYRGIQEDYKEYIETWVHEIKTPLASSRLIIENNQGEVTKKIDAQLDRMEGFIEQALYYSRSEDVSKDYIIKGFNLDKVIKNVVKKHYRDFIYKKVSLNIYDVEVMVYSDIKWTEFILGQIIGNSINYLKGTNDKISIYARSLDNSVVLTIEDNGVGIIERDINRVFDKGFTGENGRLFGKSTGMGLYLAKKLCLRLGLNISLESTEGVGTKVYIVFPKMKNID